MLSKLINSYTALYVYEAIAFTIPGAYKRRANATAWRLPFNLLIYVYIAAPQIVATQYKVENHKSMLYVLFHIKFFKLVAAPIPT